MKKSLEELNELAKRIRKDIIEMTFQAGSNGGHIGGGLSCADILAVLYGEILKIDKENPANNNRDRFILSKGHTSLAHYAALAECGILDKDKLQQFEKSGSKYSTHEEINLEDGIEISSGSLGYGSGIGVGCALALKKKAMPQNVYVLLGDGECNEGTVWEAVMSAVQFQLDNLYFIIDMNELQLDGNTRDIMAIENPVDIFHGFGCRVIEVNGNDIHELLDAFEQSVIQGKPTVILAHTKKSKGISSIEGRNGWHHASLSEEQYQSFMMELEGN